MNFKHLLAFQAYKWLMCPNPMSPVMIETSETSYTHVLEASVRMLVVDDDPIQREFATVYLTTPAAQVIAVPTAERALKRLHKEHFDIVLVDFEMPGMDGVELIKAMRAESKFAKLPIIMITGHEGIATIDAAYRAGATSFVTKPVNWRLLSYQIKYVMRAHAVLHDDGDHA